MESRVRDSTTFVVKHLVEPPRDTHRHSFVQGSCTMANRSHPMEDASFKHFRALLEMRNMLVVREQLPSFISMAISCILSALTEYSDATLDRDSGSEYSNRVLRL